MNVVVNIIIYSINALRHYKPFKSEPLIRFAGSAVEARQHLLESGTAALRCELWKACARRSNRKTAQPLM
jgi:hypothetical protein